ncbi:MAG: GWxTD domain-containing protein [Candidatus Kapaibacterium sp.]
MKNFIKITLLIMCTNFLVFASPAEEDLQIAFDAATFHLNDIEARWELYYTAPDNMLTYTKTEDSDDLMGSIEVSMKILTNGIVIKEDQWKINNYIKSTEELKQNYMFGIRTYDLAPGQYQIQISAYDVFLRTRTVEYVKDIIISKFDKMRINQSEIILASYIEKIEQSQFKLDSLYIKDDYYVIPNPRAEFYGNEARLIGAYYVYNALKFSNGHFKRSYKIYDNRGYNIYYTADTCNKPSEAILTTFNLPLDTLHSGVYFMSVSTVYPLENPVDSITSTKKFFYYDPSKPPKAGNLFTENEMFERSEFNAMNEEQTDIEIAQAQIVGTADEMYQAKSLTELKAKQRFLFKFWRARNTDTNSVFNEARRKFLHNVEYANTYFTSGMIRHGWNSERGRVLLKYGIPTRREMHNSTGEERPYEEWFYEDVQGGVHFYFVDMSYVGNFILVHSTAVNEPYFPDWYDSYVPSGRDKRIENEMKKERTGMPYQNQIQR